MILVSFWYSMFKDVKNNKETKHLNKFGKLLWLVNLSILGISILIASILLGLVELIFYDFPRFIYWLGLKDKEPFLKYLILN